jgi:hypothetical protein
MVLVPNNSVNLLWRNGHGHEITYLTYVKNLLKERREEKEIRQHPK